ncbi:MAG: hypothetical protein H6741_22830 [Alphaproteobacteria bacterium]|nr:hypothetical protein [Alphaproteobacteria bacterium]
MSPQAAALRVALLVAIGLAPACGEKEDDSTPTDDSSASDDSSTADDTSTNNLPELPGSYPDCTGPDDTGNECCVDAYSTAQVQGSCPAAAALDASELTGQSLGSGSCQCSDIEGPYADPNGGSDCYYTVGIQGCEGRPMVIAGQIRKAALARGAGWSRA